MYAVFKTGAHQYKVTKGDLVDIDFLNDKKPGDNVSFDQVLMLGDTTLKVGSPLVSGATVSAVVKEHKRLEKTYALRYTRRKNSKRMRGHRQSVTTIEISSIQGV